MADARMEGPGSSTRPVTAFVWARMTPRRTLSSQTLSIQTRNFAEKTIYSRKFALKEKISTSKGENCCYNAIAFDLINLHFFLHQQNGF